MKNFFFCILILFISVSFAQKHNFGLIRGTTAYPTWKLTGDYTSYNSFAIKISLGNYEYLQRAVTQSYSAPTTTLRTTLHVNDTRDLDNGDYYFNIYAFGADTVVLVAGYMKLTENVFLAPVPINVPRYSIIAVDSSAEDPGVLISWNSYNTIEWISMDSLSSLLNIAAAQIPDSVVWAHELADTAKSIREDLAGSGAGLDTSAVEDIIESYDYVDKITPQTIFEQKIFNAPVIITDTTTGFGDNIFYLSANDSFYIKRLTDNPHPTQDVLIESVINSLGINLSKKTGSGIMTTRAELDIGNGNKFSAYGDSVAIVSGGNIRIQAEDSIKLYGIVMVNGNPLSVGGSVGNADSLGGVPAADYALKTQIDSVKITYPDANTIQLSSSGQSILLDPATLEVQTGTLTVVGGGGTTDTTSLSNRIDLKLNATDTLSLSNRINLKLTATDTLSLSNRINLKLTATDTLSLSNRINAKQNTIPNIADTSKYVEKADSNLYATQYDLSQVSGGAGTDWADSLRIGATKYDAGLFTRSNNAESITANWVNTTYPWAENEIVSTMATEAEAITYAYRSKDSSLVSGTANNQFMHYDLGSGWKAQTAQAHGDSLFKSRPIKESDLNATNSPTDNHILSYEQASGGFTWVEDATAGSPEALEDIGDVTAYSSLGAGELLEWSGSAWVHQTLTELSLLTQAQIITQIWQSKDSSLVTGTANNQFMHYDLGSGWKAQTAQAHGDSLFKAYTNLPTATTIGSAYIYRAGGTDVAETDIHSDIARDSEVAALLTAFSDTLSFSWGVMDTTTVGALPGWKVPNNITIVEVSAYTDANTCTFNLEERGETTPNTAGTDVMASDLVADNDQQEQTSFSNATIDRNDWLVPTISATGDVAIFSITVRYVKTN